MIGLRALLLSGEIAIAWSGGQWGWDGEDTISDFKRPCLKGADVVLRVSLERGATRAEWQSRESSELSRRCRCCPIPLYVDRRPVNAPEARPGSCYDSRIHDRHSPRFLASGWFTLEGELGPPEIVSRSAFRYALSNKRPFLHWSMPCHESRLVSFRVFVSQGEKEKKTLSDLLMPIYSFENRALAEPFVMGTSRHGVLCGAVALKNRFPVWGEVVEVCSQVDL